MTLYVLDVDDVKYVINYDYPNSSEDYIHRIGRTGRCDQTGTAYTFFTPSNSRQARDLVNVLTEANQEVNPELSKLAMRGGGGGGGNWRGQFCYQKYFHLNQMFNNRCIKIFKKINNKF